MLPQINFFPFVLISSFEQKKANILETKYLIEPGFNLLTLVPNRSQFFCENIFILNWNLIHFSFIFLRAYFKSDNKINFLGSFFLFDLFQFLIFFSNFQFGFWVFGFYLIKNFWISCNSRRLDNHQLNQSNDHVSCIHCCIFNDLGRRLDTAGGLSFFKKV